MDALPALLAEQARALSIPELIAVIAAVLYLLLAIRESLWCWLFAALSTAIYVYLFFDARLYMESALNVFYFAMAIYGWQVWLRGETAGQHRRLPAGPAFGCRVSLHRFDDDLVRDLGDVPGRPQGAGELVVLARHRSCVDRHLLVT